MAWYRDLRSAAAAVSLIGCSLLLAAVTSGCSEAVFPGEQEEILTDPKEVPAHVREAAVAFCDRIGGVLIKAWYWDVEDQCWECTLQGLPRRAELDIEQDGSFSELELVYQLAEVEEALPDAADQIKSKSKNDPQVLIELSLRHEEYLNPIPGLKEAWPRDGVVIEFQCSNGHDYEMDARRMIFSRAVDDKTDPSGESE